METLKSNKNPLVLINEKECENCFTSNMVGWPLKEVFIQDENKKVWFCDFCLNKAKKDSGVPEHDCKASSDDGCQGCQDFQEGKILENRKNFENPEG